MEKVILSLFSIKSTNSRFMLFQLNDYDTFVEEVLNSSLEVIILIQHTTTL